MNTQFVSLNEVYICSRWWLDELSFKNIIKKKEKKKRINKAKKESTEILYRQVFPFESLDESFRS